MPVGQTFIDNEYLGLHPPRTSLLILPNSVSELLCLFTSKANTGKGMNGHTTDIARGDAYTVLALFSLARKIKRTGRCGHSDSVRNAYKLLAQGLYDFSKQDRLSCTSTSGKEQTPSFLGKLQDVVLLLAEGDRA